MIIFELDVSEFSLTGKVCSAFNIGHQGCLRLRSIEPEFTVWMCIITLCDEKERINVGPDAKSNDVIYSSNSINLFSKTISVSQYLLS